MINGTDEPDFSKNLSPRRFLVYIFFGMTVLMCSANSLLFAVDAKLLSDEFGISVVWLTLCSNVYNFAYVPLTLCAIRMYRTMSTATVIRIACLLLIAGAWIRNLFHYLDNVFWPLLLGQTLIACAFPILSSAITLVANRWCADTEREMVIASICIGLPLGTLIAFLWTGLSFSGTFTSKEAVF